jgi:hypothetical protein
MKAQVYHQMLGNLNKWNYLYWMSDFGGVTFRYNTLRVRNFNQADTLIKGILYNNLSVENSSGLYLREDTTSKKVYILIDTSEFILFDFSLNKGDSFYFNFPEFKNLPALYGWDKVDTIYQTQTLNGLRKTLHFKNFFHREWVEEIGSTNWIYYPQEEIKNVFTGWFSYSYLLCAWKNNTQIYQDLGWKSCYVDNTGFENLSNANPISLFPNPTTSTFTISKNTNEALQFHLYNLIGQQVLNKNLIESETIIERNNLATGTYLFSITNTSGIIIDNGKLIFE